MRKLSTVLILASILAAGSMAAPSIYAQGSQEPSGSMMHKGMMGDKNKKDDGGMMGGMGDMMGMMKQMSPMMRPGMMQGSTRAGMGALFGSRVTPIMNLSVDDVRGYLALQLEGLNNKRLKVGDLKSDEKTITADIVTVDNSLVQRLKVNRHTGAIEYEN